MLTKKHCGRMQAISGSSGVGPDCWLGLVSRVLEE